MREYQCECCYKYVHDVTAVPIPASIILGKNAAQTMKRTFLADILLCRRCEHVYKLIGA